MAQAPDAYAGVFLICEQPSCVLRRDRPVRVVRNPGEDGHFSALFGQVGAGVRCVRRDPSVFGCVVDADHQNAASAQVRVRHERRVVMWPLHRSDDCYSRASLAACSRNHP